MSDSIVSDTDYLFSSERLRRSEAAKKGHAGMHPLVAKSRGSKISKGLRSYWNSSPEFIIEAHCKSISNSIKSRPFEVDREIHSRIGVSISNTCSKRTLDKKLQVGDNISRGLNSMTPEAKVSKSLLTSSSLKAYWDNLEGEARSVRVLQTPRRGGDKATLPEIILGSYLEKRYPGRFIYNGRGKDGFAIGGRIPDFVDSKNKIIIELFGTYWHPKEDEDSRIQHYKSFGWDCKVVWEYEVYQESGLDLEIALVSGGEEVGS